MIREANKNDLDEILQLYLNRMIYKYWSLQT